MMNRQKQLESILSITLLLLIFCWITKNPFLLPASAIVAATGLLSPYLSEKIHWLFTTLTQWIGYLVSRIILSLIFFIILFPVAWLSRMISKKDPLGLKKVSTDSYYTVRNHDFNKK